MCAGIPPFVALHLTLGEKKPGINKGYEFKFNYVIGLYLVDVNIICLVIKIIILMSFGNEPPSNELNNNEKYHNLLMKAIKFCFRSSLAMNLYSLLFYIIGTDMFVCYRLLYLWRLMLLFLFDI